MVGNLASTALNSKDPIGIYRPLHPGPSTQTPSNREAGSSGELLTPYGLLKATVSASVPSGSAVSLFAIGCCQYSSAGN